MIGIGKLSPREKGRWTDGFLKSLRFINILAVMISVCGAIPAFLIGGWEWSLGLACCCIPFFVGAVVYGKIIDTGELVYDLHEELTYLLNKQGELKPASSIDELGQAIEQIKKKSQTANPPPEQQK